MLNGRLRRQLGCSGFIKLDGRVAAAAAAAAGNGNGNGAFCAMEATCASIDLPNRGQELRFNGHRERTHLRGPKTKRRALFVLFRVRNKLRSGTKQRLEIQTGSERAHSAEPPLASGQRDSPLRASLSLKPV